MSKAIRSYPEHMRPIVVARRMRQYDPKGANGLGVLAAKTQYDREQAKINRTTNKIRDNAVATLTGSEAAS